MHKLLITAQVIGYGVVALSMVSSIANSTPIAHNGRSSLTENLSGSSINIDGPVGDNLARPINSATTIDLNVLLAKRSSGKHRVHRPILAVKACQAFPCLILSQDSHNPKNRFNNPIYKLTAYRDKKSNFSFQLNAVSGRGFTQARNRYQSMTHAPLPDGSYSVSTSVVAGTIREVGGTMVPIFPKPGFSPRMRRTALGIHWDPSFDRDKKEDGTSGCVGLTTKADYHRVRNFIFKYHPRSLEVNIDT